MHRFWKKVEPTGFCWLWLGHIEHGYGRVMVDYVRWQAHRFAYTYLVGPIPENAVLDHLCRNKACVNPDHLEIVTVRENTLRGYGLSARNAKKTVCDSGHALTPDNIYKRKDRPGRRECRTCRREARARCDQRNREAATHGN